MNITKIKLEMIKTEVHYTKVVGTTELETKVKCDKPRDPEFTKISQSFIDYIVNTLGLPEAWKSFENSFIQSIKLDKTDSGIGVVFDFVHKLECFTSPLVIKTPRYCEGHNKDLAHVLPVDTANNLYRLIEHAVSFVNGKRHQRDMFAASVAIGEIQEEVL